MRTKRKEKGAETDGESACLTDSQPTFDPHLWNTQGPQDSVRRLEVLPELNQVRS